MQTRTDKHIKGIDVSRHQGAIDWMAMRAAGVQFVYIKATEGVTYIDMKLKEHYSGARRAGLRIGFYHYARPYNDPRKEVENLLKATKDLPHDLPFALDIETNEGKYNREQITFFSKKWLEEIERLTGETPIVYTYTHFAKSYLGPELRPWPVWIAHYGVKTPGDNGVWGNWAAFQYTSDNDGLPYNGRLDVNVMEPDFFANWNAKQLPAVEGACGVLLNGERIGGGYIIEARAHVPIRLIAELFGAEVGWDGANVVLTTKGAK
ncbi:GH25 family lysozyme [Paenibacillus sp.]|uniref:GH25 family lysozyme n=1 Tax=Paenibacillus sp. TaxID=58172 RepID=UPI00281260BA|nr:GH25 family lysozyme [Paenibacillus sp.]